MRRRLLLVASVLLLLGAAVFVWRYTPLAQFASAERLTDWIGGFQAKPWSPAAVVGLYILGGFVAFPLTLLIATTAIVFPPAIAVTIAFAGSLISAAMLHGVGARLIRGTLHESFGQAVGRINRVLEARGVITVALVRLAPIAPFTLVNLAAGSIGVRFGDYMIGTALGLAPGIAVMAALGSQLRSLWERPSAQNIAILVGIVIAWIAVSLTLQWAVARQRRRTGQPVP